ncbi:MAG: uridine phosphorylase [Acidimicrobiales bacterium]|jgi:uridine phosphorylase
MDFADLPLGELDTERVAILEPQHIGGDLALPERAVLCFFFDVLARRGADPASGWTELGTRDIENGPRTIWQVGEGDDAVAVLNPGTGAPTSVTMLELVIAAGAKTVVAVGGAGALVDELALGNVVVPTKALRDEGTSFHYLPPSRFIDLDSEVAGTLDAFLTERHVPHELAPVWTTDGLFRETPDKVQRRRDEGCVLVDMECSALAAVCQFRGVRFGQFLYAGDSLATDDWDARGWNQATDVRETLLDLAIDAARKV